MTSFFIIISTIIIIINLDIFITLCHNYYHYCFFYYQYYIISIIAIIILIVIIVIIIVIIMTLLNVFTNINEHVFVIITISFNPEEGGSHKGLCFFKGGAHRFPSMAIVKRLVERNSNN